MALPNAAETSQAGILFPADGAQVRGRIMVGGYAVAPLAPDPKTKVVLSGVSYRLDNSDTWIAVNGTEIWSAEIDTTNLSNGRHTISVKANSSLGESIEYTRTINVDNAGTAIIQENGPMVLGALKLNASVIDLPADSLPLK
jgi:hypothetical protein